MYKILIACMMIVSLNTSRVLEKQEVSCKVSITQDEQKKEGEAAVANVKVAVNCEDLTSKKKMTQNLTCKSNEKFEVFKVNKAAVKKTEDKQVKTDQGKDKVVDNSEMVVDSKVNQEDVSSLNVPQNVNVSDQKIDQVNQTPKLTDQNPLENKQTPVQDNSKVSDVQNPSDLNKKRILAEEPKELVNSYELTVGEQTFNLDNYSLQSIDKLDGCKVLVKGSLINSILKFAFVLILGFF